MKRKSIFRIIFVCMILVLTMTAITYAASSTALKQTDNSIYDYGYLKNGEYVTYNFKIKSKSNVVMQFIQSHDGSKVNLKPEDAFVDEDGNLIYDTCGVYKLTIKNSSNKIVYESPIWYEGSKYNVSDAGGNPFQLSTVLPAGTYKMTLKACNPWTKKDDPAGDFTYILNMKWAKTSEFMEEVYVPSKPKLTVSNVASTGKPKLAWNKVKGADVYEVARASKGSEGIVDYRFKTTENSFIDKTAKPEKTYVYYVVAINSKYLDDWNGMNQGRSYSDSLTITCDLARPTVNASNSPSSGKVKLTWDAVSGADKYEIYRSGYKDGTYKKMYTTTNTSYVNTSATPEYLYYYKVKAISTKTSAANSANSAIVSRRCDLARPKVSTSNVASTGKVRLTWDKVSGADKYDVYRATSKNGTYKKLSTTTGTSFTNTSAVAENIYYYRVQAISTRSSGANSAKSEIVSRRCDLARPEVSVARLSSGGIKVSWKAVNGADKYEVYRATSKNGTYSKYVTTTKTSYTNTAVKSGKTYYYKVKAISTKSSYANSAYSTVVYRTAK